MKFARYSLLGIIFLYIFGVVIYLQMRLLFGDSFWWLAIINMFGPFLMLPLVITLVITLVARSWLLAGINLALIIIGLIWVLPGFLPKGQPAVIGTPLKVITMNVLPGNRQINEVKQWLSAESPDLIFLQDIGGDRDLNQFNDFDSRYNYQFREGAGEGQIIFSMYPITAINSYDLDGDSRFDLQRAIIQLDTLDIAVYNVHLENPIGRESRFPMDIPFFPDFILRYNDEVRNTQIEALLTYIQQESLPFIIAGDFNMGSYSAIYSNLATVMQDTFVEAGSGLGATWVAPVPDRRTRLPLILRIDYIWHSPETIKAIKLEVGPEIGSDHLPLIAELDVLPLTVSPQ